MDLEAFRTRGWILLVADGMGAHAAGEEASRMAAERIPLLYKKTHSETPPEALQQAFQKANSEIFEKGEKFPEFHGMGTTCSALTIVPRGALIGHIGDSRIYRIRGHQIEQLTRDHSLAWECGLAGEEAKGIPKNIITRSMGPHPAVDADLEGPWPVHEGDIFVLCSDGLSGQLSDAEIGLLASYHNLGEATQALVGLTLARGAPDNTTVLLARAGAEEVTNTFAKQEPWSLTDSVNDDITTRRIAWKPLIAAGICFFLSLIMKGDLLQPSSPFLEAMIAISVVTTSLATIVFLCYALLSSVSQGDTARGSQQIKGSDGPYRDADCTPTEALLENLAKTIDSASNSLPPSDRESIIDLASKARSGNVDHGFSVAITSAIQALCRIENSLPRQRDTLTIHDDDIDLKNRPDNDH